MVKTFMNKLQDFSKSIQEDLKKLLLEYSTLVYDDPDTDGICFLMSGKYCWQELPLEGKRLQSKILDEFSKYKDIVENLIDKGNLSKLKQNYKTFEDSIQQKYMSFYKTTQEAFEKATNAFSEIDQLLDSLHSSNDCYLMVVDTNALLINPKIEGWCFDGIGSFTIVLTPTILSELDELKVNHRNVDVREKSKKLINQIKEYSRRGSLLDGVNIKKNNITLKSIAVEPNFQNTLPWLDKNNNDDRFIASVFEIIKNNIRSAVYVVTADINMQNKAEFSCLPFLEPPQPIGT